MGGAIAVARWGGQTFTLQEMLMFFLVNDMIVPGSTYWNMVFGWLPREALKDVEGIDTIRHFASNVAKLVKKLFPDNENPHLDDLDHHGHLHWVLSFFRKVVRRLASPVSHYHGSEIVKQLLRRCKAYVLTRWPRTLPASIRCPRQEPTPPPKP